MNDMSKFVQTKSNLPVEVDPRYLPAEAYIPEGQADDRTPMDGSVKDSGETPPGQRAFARRRHQVMFKKWSQTRRD
jgi:hypothetical protein